MTYYIYNSAWADELTSYNGNAISYDALGNRTSYNGWTYTWEVGRLLTGMTNTDGTTIAYKYDVDGSVIFICCDNYWHLIVGSF